MRKIEGPEGKILKKYVGGRVVDPEDESMIKQLSRTGLMHRGLSIKQKKRTAKTTVLGCRGIK